MCVRYKWCKDLNGYNGSFNAHRTILFYWNSFVEWQLFPFIVVMHIWYMLIFLYIYMNTVIILPKVACKCIDSVWVSRNVHWPLNEIDYRHARYFFLLHLFGNCMRYWMGGIDDIQYFLCCHWLVQFFFLYFFFPFDLVLFAFSILVRANWGANV